MNTRRDLEHELIERYLRGELGADELAAFERSLRDDAGARARYRKAARLDANLRSLAAVEQPELVAWRDQGAPDGTRSTALRGRLTGWFPWLTWRPFAAAAAGLALGLFSASVVWTYGSPRAAKVLERILPLANRSFENASETLPDGIPKQFGVWSGDFSRVVGAEQGVAPKNGQHMLRVLRSDSSVDAPGRDSHGGDLMQLVDLRPFKPDFATGNTVLEASAACSMVRPAAGQKFRFTVQAFAFSGSAADLGSDPQDILQMALASGAKHVKLRGDSSAWQEGTARMLLPADADFVMVKLTVTQAEPRQPGHVEFAGHYMDDVKLVLTTPPSRLSRFTKR